MVSYAALCELIHSTQCVEYILFQSLRKAILQCQYFNEVKAGMAASLACRDARFSTSNACGSRIILMTSGPFPNAKKYDLSTYAATESALRGNKFN